MNQLQQLFSHHSAVKLLPLSFIIGIGGALGAVVFHLLIEAVTKLFFGAPSPDGFIATAEALPDWYRVIIPAIGGLCVGLLYKLSRVPEAEGEGVPEVIEALAIARGKIRPLVAPVKTLASAITIGSGGSAGREGPIIQIGSAIGSNIGQMLRLHTHETSQLLAIGAAAGVAGTFSAPLAGVIFSIEVLRARADAMGFVLLGCAAIVSAVVTESFIGHTGLSFALNNVPLLTVPQSFTFLLLGTLCGLVAILFGLSLRAASSLFKTLPLFDILRPALGGLIIGCIALYIPHLYEPASYPLMMDISNLQTLSLSFLFVLLVGKIIATSLTLGSGGSGGVFAPSLLIGLIVGSLFGVGLAELTSLGADPVLYALVGMAALFAGVAHAPLTSILIVYEFTDEPMLLPALIVACLTSYFISSHIRAESIYHH